MEKILVLGFFSLHKYIINQGNNPARIAVCSVVFSFITRSGFWFSYFKDFIQFKLPET